MIPLDLGIKSLIFEEVEVGVKYLNVSIINYLHDESEM